MPHPDHFKPLPPIGAVMYGAVPLTEGITFYPDLRYHGMKVSPRWWDTQSEEPVLVVLATPNTFDDLDTPYYHAIRDQINARYPEYVLMADGWDQPGRGEFSKRIHVDDLEKIEGPPPEGPF